MRYCSRIEGLSVAGAECLFACLVHAMPSAVGVRGANDARAVASRALHVRRAGGGGAARDRLAALGGAAARGGIGAGPLRSAACRAGVLNADPRCAILIGRALLTRAPGPNRENAAWFCRAAVRVARAFGALAKARAEAAANGPAGRPCSGAISAR